MVEMPPERMPEPELNGLLRRVDWRFLLANPEPPRILDLGSGIDREALGLIGDTSESANSNLVLTGFPRRERLLRAREALAPGGEIVCLWRTPRSGGATRARRRLIAAGFEAVRVYWPGPVPSRPPQFWLPVESRAARRQLLSTRPAHGPGQGALRLAWRLAAEAGLLAPACAVARLPATEGVSEPDEERDWLLLTGGKRSINKVVGLPVATDGSPPHEVTKFARVAAANESLEHEAAALERIEAMHPGIEGVPRLISSHTRVGCRALVESAIPGEPLIASLTQATVAELTARVGDWLARLTSAGPTLPPGRWWGRLVEEPLARLEDDFGAVAPDIAARCATALDGLGPLPTAVEHRDCSPWNVVIDADGSLGLHDWESAEPDGLPLLDLIYFAANAAFVLDGALEKGTARLTYERLLDPGNTDGRLFGLCLDEHAALLSIAATDVARLRLLCWVIHAHSERRHLEMEAAGTPSAETLRAATFLGLIEEELEHADKVS